MAEELDAHLLAQQQLAVAPTVTALRARANQVIEAELARLYGRLPEIDDHVRREVSDAVRRAVEKVMHAPTVRVKELASMPGGDQYATALRELFDLDPAAVESVAAVKKNVEDRPMTATRTLRVGTRNSALARVQTGLVVDALGADVEIVPIVTEGDGRRRRCPDRRDGRVRLGAADRAAGRRDRRRRPLVQGSADGARAGHRDRRRARPRRTRATRWWRATG